MITAEKIVALARYVRSRDGDALASPEHREFMREMSEWLMSVGIVAKSLMNPEPKQSKGGE